MKVREAQTMINKYNSWKQNLCDIQERRDEKKNHTPSVWNSTVPAQDWKTLNEKSLKSGVGVFVLLVHQLQINSTGHIHYPPPVIPTVKQSALQLLQNTQKRLK